MSLIYLLGASAGHKYSAPPKLKSLSANLIERFLTNSFAKSIIAFWSIDNANIKPPMTQFFNPVSSNSNGFDYIELVKCPTINVNFTTRWHIIHRLTLLFRLRRWRQNSYNTTTLAPELWSKPGVEKGWVKRPLYKVDKWSLILQGKESLHWRLLHVCGPIP